MLWEPLVGDGTDIHRLGLGSALTDALMQAGLRTVGSLAEATRENLTSIPRVGGGRVAQIVEALQKFADSTAQDGVASSLDEIWRRATAPLKGHQHTVLARLYGIEGEHVGQVELAEALSMNQPAVSHAMQKAKDMGELFEAPMYPREAIGYAIRRERLPMSLAELHQAVERTFGQAVGWPDPDTLAKTLAGLEDCRVEGDQVVSVVGKSVVPETPRQDPIPQELRVAAKTPEWAALDLLRAASQRGDGFRLVVSPAETHSEVARSIARALGEHAEFISLEHELLARMDSGFDNFTRAERFKAQRGKLTREAETLLADLLREKGRSGTSIVLGDTGLYDETNAGGRGFWITVVPGVMYQKQPLFLERTPLFHLESTLPISREIEA